MLTGKKKLKWRDPLYVGESAKRSERRIRRRLDAGRADVGHYVVTLAANGVDELDVVGTGFLAQDALRDRLPLIVGLAGSRKEALGLVRTMAEDCVRETGGVRLRAYLTEDGKDGRG